MSIKNYLWKLILIEKQIFIINLLLINDFGFKNNRDLCNIIHFYKTIKPLMNKHFVGGLLYRYLQLLLLDLYFLLMFCKKFSHKIIGMKTIW